MPEAKDMDDCLGQLVVLCKLYSHSNINRAIKKVQDLIERNDDILEKLLYSNMSMTEIQH